MCIEIWEFIAKIIEINNSDYPEEIKRKYRQKIIEDKLKQCKEQENNNV